MSTETPGPEDPTASAEEKAKTGAPLVADSKEDSVTKLKEERDQLVVRLYLSPLPLVAYLLLLFSLYMHDCARRTVYGMPKQT